MRVRQLLGRGSVLITLVATFAGFASSAKGSAVTFALFHEAVNGNDNLFSYTASGIAGSGGAVSLTAVSVPVDFNYSSIPNLPVDLQGVQSATLTLTCQTISPAVTGFGGTFGEELLPAVQSVLDTLTITRTTPAAEGLGVRTNLLSVSFSGELLAGLGGNTAQLTGQTGLGDAVNFTSDFLAFPLTPGAVTPADISLSFTSWTSGDGGGVEFNPNTQFFNSAVAAATGNFDFQNASVLPEPSALLLGATIFLGFLSRRGGRCTA